MEIILQKGKIEQIWSKLAQTCDKQHVQRAP